MSDWNPAQYLAFEAQRTLPAQDLAAKIPLQNPADVLDVGCGPGNSTAVLHSRFPRARITGADSAESMVAAAKEAHPHLRFTVCDISGPLPFAPGAYNVVFSNACLQWVPNHAALLPRLMELLRPGGALAVQVPMNYDEPIHTIVQQVAQNKIWRPFFKTPHIFYTLRPAQYYDILCGTAATCAIWQTTYYHVLPGHESILQWYRSTGLRPYLGALPRHLRPSFEAEIFAQLQKAYPLHPDGQVLFAFPRFFFVATK